MASASASTDRDGLPSFTALAPVLDRLADLAERELHDPVMIDVKGWDDGDVTAVAEHRFGAYQGTAWTGREVLRYDPDAERFELRYIEENDEIGDQLVLDDRVLEHYS